MPASTRLLPLIRRTRPRAVAVTVAAVVAAAGLSVAPSVQPAARAADTDVVVLPDATVQAAVNAALGADRGPEEEVTVAEAASLTSLTVPVADDPASDLTGLQAFTRLTSLTVAADRELSDVTALAGLPLTTLSIAGGAIQGTLGSVGAVNT